jgi:hypothetical protein
MDERGRVFPEIAARPAENLHRPKKQIFQASQTSEWGPLLQEG